MKKLIFALLLLCSIQLSAQYYTYIGPAYEWRLGMFRALGLPSGDTPAFITGQTQRAGQLYYDTLGVDAGLYIWTGLAWSNISPPATVPTFQQVLTAGSTLTGNNTIQGGNFRYQMLNTNLLLSGNNNEIDFDGVLGLTITANAGRLSLSAFNGTYVGRLISTDYIHVANGSELRLGSNASDLSTPANGDMFYNSGRNKFRGYEGSVWKDFISSNSTFRNNTLLFRDTPDGDFGDFNFTTLDTITSPDTWGAKSGYGFSHRRTLRFPSYSPIQYKGGADFQLVYEIKDSMRATAHGGDFGAANKSSIWLRKMAGYSGRSVYVGGATYTDATPVHITQLLVSNPTSSSGNYRYVMGWWSGYTSMLYNLSLDTIDNYAGFIARSFVSGRVKNFYSYMAEINITNADNQWAFYSGATNAKSSFAGAFGLGDSVIHASSLLDISSTTKGVLMPRMTSAQRTAITGVAGLILFDTDSASYFQYTGSAWQNLYGGGTGGGSSGTFIGLTDVPATYTGQALKLARVNAGETALEFYANIGSIGVSVDGQGGIVSIGSKGFITIPYDATITNWYVACDVSGSVQFDVKRSGASIVGGGNKPLLSGAISGNAAVSGWTSTAITAGDIIEWNVDSGTTITNCSCNLKIVK